MPKIPKSRIERNRGQIEQAALRLFTSQGFHGTNIRDIAEAAEVSTGAIYTYFPTKDALFESIVHSYEERIRNWRNGRFSQMPDPFSKKNLQKLAEEIRSFVYDHADYWKLMYIDVVEFNNRHFAQSFHNVPGQFRWRFDEQLEKVTQDPDWCGIDPGFVIATIYLQILTYFLVERLFGGNQHLGVSDETAVKRIIDLALQGIWRPSSGQSGIRRGRPSAGSKKTAGKRPPAQVQGMKKSGKLKKNRG